jgi:uncharacterized protein
VTGFGCTVLALPFVTALLGLKNGVLVLAALAWLLALYFVITKFGLINFREYGVIVLFAGLGLPFGMYVFAALPAPLLKKALAVFIVLVSAWQLIRLIRGTLRESRIPKPVLYFFLFLGGVFHGAFASGGPLIVLYASRVLSDKGSFRATLCLLWTSLNTILLAGFWLSGAFNAERLAQIGALLPFLGLGILAGEFIHQRVDAPVFSRVVFGALLATGLVMLAV